MDPRDDRRRLAAPDWLLRAVPLVAFVLGVSVDHLGASQRINVLAPPLLALLAWNFVVYAVLSLHALRPAAPGRSQHRLMGLFGPGAPTPDFVARLTSVFHVSAALLALGALTSLYLRGLVFEYRAGWDSTFLSADTVSQLLHAVFGPAAWLSGTTLPSSDELAHLRFSSGPGENAAHWIHLQAITLVAAVVLPRLALAAWEMQRARRLARPPLQAEGGHVAVWPYSHHASAEALQGLTGALQRALGAGTTVHVADVVPLGGEDELATWSGSTPAIALFNASATPERENHGAFIDALARRGGVRPRLLVDESAFRQRFTGDSGDARLQQRREAWRTLARDHSVAIVFIDLLNPDLDRFDREWRVAEGVRRA